MLQDILQVYRDYNLAIARCVTAYLYPTPDLMYSNDGLNLRAVAMGDALAHGQAVIKANKRMEWGMAMGQHQPRILWARIAQVHEDAEVGQVAVRFDTNQVSLPRFSNAHTWDQKTDG